MRKAIIEQPSTATRGSGGSVREAWTARTTAFVEIEPLRGNELFNAQQKYGKVTARAKLYHHFGIGPDMRILYPREVGNLSSAVTDAAFTDIEVTTGLNFPPRGDFFIKIEDELMNVTQTSGSASTAWTVERAQDGTAASTHDAATLVQRMVVYDVISPVENQYEDLSMTILVSERM